ncbi:hypothetical protein D3C76_1815600 [compost metagenome]
MDIGIVLVQQQPRGGQRAEQRLLVDQGLQGLMQILCVAQGVARGSVVAGQ